MACLVSRQAPLTFSFSSFPDHAGNLLNISCCREFPQEYLMFIPSVLFFIFTRSLTRGYLVTLSANLTQFCLTSETRLCADIIKAGHYHWDYEGLYLSLIMKTLTRITTTTKLKRRITTQTDLKIFLHNFCFFLLRAIWSP